MMLPVLSGPPPWAEVMELVIDGSETVTGRVTILQMGMEAAAEVLVLSSLLPEWKEQKVVFPRPTLRVDGRRDDGKLAATSSGR